MSTGALVSVEEYLRRTEKPNAEYIDGLVRPKPLPTKKHSELEFLLCLLLKQRGLEAVHELTVRLSPTKYLVPDVAADKHIQDPYPTEPVLLCCEILSPEDRVGALLAKCEEYHAWGVPYCWVLDPQKQKAWEYHKGSDPVSIEPGGSLRAGDLSLPLTKLFSEAEKF